MLGDKDPIASAHSRAVSFYGEHCGLFVRLILPAVIFSAAALSLGWYFSATTLRDAALEWRATGEWPMAKILLASTIRFLTVAVSWIIFCFSFGAIAVAVDELLQGGHPYAEGCYGAMRERFGGLVLLAMILGAIIFSLMAIPAGIATVWALRVGLRDPFPFVTVLAVDLIALGLVVRWTFALPAFALDHKPSWESIRWSDKASDGYLLQLWWLFLLSEGLAWLLGNAPGYVARALGGYLTLPRHIDWVVYISAVLLAGLVQPIPAIGTALLYLEARQPQRGSAVDPPETKAPA